MFSPTFLLFVFIPSVIISAGAAWMVRSAFGKYKRVRIVSGASGAEAATAMLHRAGVEGVRIERVKGFLSDHYDPRSRTLRLSPDVYDGRSVASVGVALHEAGHALQHADKYVPLQLRSALVPIASFGMSPFLPGVFVVLGVITHFMAIAYLGLALFLVAFIFTVVTLPVEINASTRAKRAALDLGIVSPGAEAAGVSTVLNAAALTYVAAAAVALLNLVYYAAMVRD